MKIQPMNVWKMITHHTNPENAIAWTHKSNRIAIGWGRIGDVSKYCSSSEIKKAIREFYPISEYSNNAHLGAPSLWNFCYEMKKDDLVILSGRTPRTLVVQIVGNYEYVPEESPPPGEYFNQRIIRVTTLDPNKLWTSAGEAPGSQRYQTLVKCAQPVNIES